MFDVRYLGSREFGWSEALGVLQTAFSNGLRRIAPGRAQYTHLLDAAGDSVVDDIIVWWLYSSSGAGPDPSGGQSSRSGWSRRIWSNMGWALNQLAKSPATWRWVIAAVSSSMSTGSPAASASNWA